MYNNNTYGRKLVTDFVRSTRICKEYPRLWKYVQFPAPRHTLGIIIDECQSKVFTFFVTGARYGDFTFFT